ncbi:MAG: hypothetical protein LQ338_006009 [Usnochroma carphineum]|nr:MAG: hypothetical protein LQ338_006009 [Usnochroma carphineum]
MVKPLAFKGDKKPKKRKAAPAEDDLQVEKKARESATDVQEGDSWVTADTPGDINGPVLIVLPSTPPSCIACDVGGKVFVSELENMVERDPATAEPHDVRQVWIASKIAGTDNVGLKGHHGRYLSCDNIGIFSARTEAMSPEETFAFIASPDTPGTFNIQTQREKFISVTEDGKEIRGDAESVSSTTTVRIRMQARFKPKLKANKEMKAKEKISRKELEDAVGRKLDDDEVRKLKKARVEGSYHEAILDVRVKGKHDKYS